MGAGINTQAYAAHQSGHIGLSMMTMATAPVFQGAGQAEHVATGGDDGQPAVRAASLTVTPQPDCQLQGLKRVVSSHPGWASL